ncbi:MAG: signal recognition particle-docking protein FtsY [Salinisphaera sp.]|nr:signal recognition particle-docking protein FtsY [Salinisphaera sp.]
MRSNPKQHQNRPQLRQPGFVTRMRARVNRADSWLTYDLRNLLPGDHVDQDAIDTLETELLLADVGVEATGDVIGRLQTLFDGGRLRNPADLGKALREHLGSVLAPAAAPLEIPEDNRPFVVLMVGVNGAGKTTTVGKLAQQFRQQGLSVMLAAGDTFRAAAVEQIQAWGTRTGVPVISQPTGSDPASVAYDAFAAARARGSDVLIVDTAGRLHTQRNLMEELRKVRRVLAKQDESAPHEVLLVVDATTGGNALQQALQFREAVGVTGLVVTKLDGSARGGAIFAIAKRLALPIRFIGVGESAEDLGVFDPGEYMEALFRE